MGPGAEQTEDRDGYLSGHRTGTTSGDGVSGYSGKCILSRALPPQCREVLEDIMSRLPELGRLVMRDGGYPEGVRQFAARIQQLEEEFRAMPDSPTQHEPRWHQYGIVTHSGKVLEAAIEGELSMLLVRTGLDRAFSCHMLEEIDGRSKLELFVTSIPLHDLGKFARTYAPTKPGYEWTDVKPDYTGHEAISGQLIRSNPAVYEVLAAHGYTSNQIEYVARCAELHFEFGHLRTAAKCTACGYAYEFIGSQAMEEGIDEVLRRHPFFGVEISTYFLIDSLGKLGIRIVPSGDGMLTLVTPAEAIDRNALPLRAFLPLDSAPSTDGVALVREALSRRAAEGESSAPSPVLSEAIWQLPVNMWVALHALERSLAPSGDLPDDPSH